jgi:hypothetical protein
MYRVGIDAGTLRLPRRRVDENRFVKGCVNNRRKCRPKTVKIHWGLCRPRGGIPGAFPRRWRGRAIRCNSSARLWRACGISASIPNAEIRSAAAPAAPPVGLKPLRGGIPGDGTSPNHSRTFAFLIRAHSRFQKRSLFKSASLVIHKVIDK